jgi:hypothetical protein
LASGFRSTTVTALLTIADLAPEPGLHLHSRAAASTQLRGQAGEGAATAGVFGGAEAGEQSHAKGCGNGQDGDGQ